MTEPRYEVGACFRCDRDGIQVTPIGEITTGQGETPTPIEACRSCLERLVVMHDQSGPVRRYTAAL
ncbi:hypothetical protein [Streptomyces liangshanensis]|uniref:hypothetical protein n=1 Tax=Streptomyces liangshanensis TaxID=2717324 RepID=UPI0036DF2E1B